MAITRKLVSNKSVSSEKPTKSRLELKLCKEPNEPSSNLTDYSLFIYGAKGIGKTALAAQFRNPYFLSLEPGTRAMRGVKSSDIPDWDHFVGYIDLLEKEEDPEMTTVVDVVDLAYDFIYEKTCKRQGIDSPTDENDFGATWRKIRKGFREQIMRICRFPGGKIFLSHDVEKEIELRDGTKVDRIQPTMGRQALGEVEGIVDIVANYAYDGEDRFLCIKGSQTMLAKSRLEYNFVRKGGEPMTGGDYIRRIPMGESPKEAYNNLIKAFNNKQEWIDGVEPTERKSLKKKFKLKSS